MIEDSSFDRKILVNILAKEGYKEVIEVKDGDESVTKYKTEKLALVLRYYYEKKEGVESMREIMAIDKKAKVVMVGAVGQEQMIKKEMELGAEDFIVNLFNTSNVEERVKKMLKWNFLEGFF